MKRPAFMFFPGDWQHDVALGVCSAAARGVWMELLCLMHQAEPYGYLLINNNAPNDEMIARSTRLSVREIRNGISQLEKAGVLKRREDGVIFSDRMIRDENRRKDKARSGQLGAEHGSKAQENPNASRPGDRRGGGRPRKPPIEPPFHSNGKPPIKTRAKPPLSNSRSSSCSSLDSKTYDDGHLDPETRLDVRLRTAGFVGKQVSEFAQMDRAFVERWLSWLALPDAEIERPVGFAVAGMREGLEPPTPTQAEPVPITAEQRAMFGDEAQQRALQKFPNLRPQSASLPQAIEAEIRALVAENSGVKILEPSDG